jgi:transposase
LHSLGLLTQSFRPDADLIALRTLLRHRSQLIEHRSPHLLHMQKALIHMNIRLDQAVSNPTGDTGLRIIRAIVAGELDPRKLAALRHPNCKKSEAEIARALTGTWQEEPLFVLKQSLAMDDFYTRQIEACDAEIERTYSAIRPAWPDPDPADQDPLPAHKRDSHSKNLPKDSPVQVRRHLRRLTGIDLTAVDGLSLDPAQKIVSEIGTDMSQFPSEKHFTSWLKLAPNNQITGGKIIRSSTGKSHNLARQAFLQTAASVARSHCAFGAFYRRLKARVGPAQAQVATRPQDRPRGVSSVKEQGEYQQMSAEEYAQQFRARELRHLQRKAARLGFTLTPAGAVS